jgi:hypothetical protein
MFHAPREAAGLVSGCVLDLSILGDGRMDYSDYLREQAAECRRLAEAAADPAVREDLFESAAIYEEVANDLDDRRASG